MEKDGPLSIVGTQRMQGFLQLLRTTYLRFDICYSFLICRSSLIYVTDNTIASALAMEKTFTDFRKRRIRPNGQFNCANNVMRKRNHQSQLAGRKMPRICDSGSGSGIRYHLAPGPTRASALDLGTSVRNRTNRLGGGGVQVLYAYN